MIKPESPEIELSMDELRELTRWAVACARRVLPIFEEAVPDDSRPWDAIATADEFVETGKRSNVLRMSGLAAYKASRQFVDNVATSEAALSATQAVGAAYLHPIASPLQVRHILGAAAHGIHAIEATGDLQASREYKTWAIQSAPKIIGVLLNRFPSAAKGGGHTGEIIRDLDTYFRTH